MECGVTQLETHSSDVERGARRPWNPGVGRRHRTLQIENLLRAFRNTRPAILLGDWNATVDCVELHSLEKKGFHPADLGGVMGSNGLVNKWAEPYSHVDHHLRIDHAFVRGLPAGWSARQYLLELDDENSGARWTDHRPLVLELSR